MKKRRRKRRVLGSVLAALLPLLLFFCLGIGYYVSLSGFSISKIRSSLDDDAKWDVIPISKEENALLQEIFAQKFTYLDDGARSYSFVSDNDEYVLKFFKMHRLTAKNWLNYVPIPRVLDRYRFEKIDKRNLKLWDVFESCKLAYEQMKEETGLIYVHLNKTRDLKVKVQLVDEDGRAHFVDLDSVEFVMQKRAIPLHQRIKELMEEKDWAGVQVAFEQVLRLVKSRGEKRIINLEVEQCDVTRDYGFIDDVCVHVDIAGFNLTQDSHAIDRELLQTFESLQAWIQENYPDLEHEFITPI